MSFTTSKRRLPLWETVAYRDVPILLTSTTAASYDCSILVGHLERLGYHVRRPYHSGGEAVKVPLTQPQFDALVSFTFNLAAGGFESSTLLERLNGREFDAVPGELGKWVKAGGKALPGLARRRSAEGRLFETGVYAES